MINKLFIIIFILYTPLFSYLDPGTGSMLLSSIIALIATMVYSAKNFFYNIRSFINKMFNKNTHKNVSSIVLYNEGNQYFSTFYPVINEMIKRDIEFLYLYSGEDDLIIKSIENINSHCIGVSNKAFLYLNTLEADVCVMTTPGLDIFQIKRSAGVKHYMHLHHAASGTAGYKVFSTDCFDSVLVPNRADKEFIRELEQERNIPKKIIEVTGTAYLDYFSQEIEKINVEKSNKINVLISPTWGEHGLLSKIGFELIETLISYKSFNLTIRPHPQSVIYEKKLLENLKTKFDKNVQWDYENNALSSIVKADIMISDFSGIILDFLFLFNKQVIAMPSEFNYDGKDYINRDTSLWHTDFFLKNTIVINESHIKIKDYLKNLIDTAIQDKNSDNNHDELNPFFKKSAIKTVDIIEKISKGLEK